MRITAGDKQNHHAEAPNCFLLSALLVFNYWVLKSHTRALPSAKDESTNVN